MVHPFNLKTALLAKHAQHVVLIHFPIALFITAVAFDFMGQWWKRARLADAAYYNLLAAAISTFPVLVTGALAWQSNLKVRTRREFCCCTWSLLALPLQLSGWLGGRICARGVVPQPCQDIGWRLKC
jgi:hypothetical protein